MICLAYYSSASAMMTSSALGAIVQQAQENNIHQGITGLLCHLDGSFMQFLEGEAASIDQAFDKIRRDPRHRHVLQVHKAPITTRLFADWSMAIIRPDEVSPAQRNFCHALREVEIAGGASHQAEFAGFLSNFRKWLR